MTTYGFSTYKQLIDEVQFDFDIKLQNLPTTQLQRYILEGEQKLCSLVQVRSKSTLSLVLNQEDYRFTDAPTANEIPSEVKRIYLIDRLQDTLYRTIKIVNEKELRGLRRKEFYPVYLNWDIPYCAAIWRDGTSRYFSVYPKPDANKDITIYTILNINPRLHITDLVTDYIDIESTYDPALRAYLAFKIARLNKDKENEKRFLSDFNEEVLMLRANILPEETMEVSYV